MLEFCFDIFLRISVTHQDHYIFRSGIPINVYFSLFGNNISRYIRDVGLSSRKPAVDFDDSNEGQLIWKKTSVYDRLVIISVNNFQVVRWIFLHHQCSTATKKLIKTIQKGHSSQLDTWQVHGRTCVFFVWFGSKEHLVASSEAC